MMNFIYAVLLIVAAGVITVAVPIAAALIATLLATVGSVVLVWYMIKAYREEYLNDGERTNSQADPESANHVDQ